MWRRLSPLFILLGAGIAVTAYLQLRPPSIHLVWSSPLSPDLHFDSALAIGESSLLVYGENTQPTLLGLDGAVKWVHQLQNGEEVLAALDLNGRALIGTTGNRLICLNAEGETSWGLDLSETQGVGVLPITGPDGNIYATYSEPGICKVSPGGKLIWKKSIEDIADGMPFAIDNAGIYLTDYMLGVMALDHSGNIKWRISGNLSFGYEPSVRQGQVTFLQINQGTITALDTSSGDVKYTTSYRYHPGSKESMNSRGYLLTVEQHPDAYNVRDTELKVIATHSCSADEVPIYSTNTVDSLDRFWIMRNEMSDYPDAIKGLPVSTQRWIKRQFHRRTSARLQLLTPEGKELSITRIRSKHRWIYPVALSDGTVVFFGRDKLYCYGFGK
jgi:outer membrane protein assembly factor BamB